jgi:hypothetical protein
MYVPPIDYTAEVQAAVTKTASFDGAAYDLGAGYTPGGLGRVLAAVVDVTALDLASTNETYVFKLQESANGSTGWTDIGPSVSATAVGNVVVKGIVTTRHIRLVLTAAGTTPSITYSAKLGL